MMNTQKHAFLTLTDPPARLNMEQVAWKLGFEAHDIPVLVKAGLLKPLGNPAPNAPKYFAAFDILEKAKDSTWLNKATRAMANHWKTKNARVHRYKSSS